MRLTDDEKRKKVNDTVLSLIAKHGVDATSTRSISKALGVSQPTLYRVYRNKKEILLAATDAAWQARLDSIHVDEPDAIEHLKKRAEYHTDTIQRSKAVGALHQLAVASDTHGLRERLREHHLAEVKHLANIVEAGKIQGTIRRDVDSEETGWRILATYFSEVTAHLLGFQEQLMMSGIMKTALESILDDIVVSRPDR